MSMSRPAARRAREVGDGGLRAGEDDEVGVGREDGAGAEAEEVDLRLGGERVEVVEVGDVRQDRHGDAQAAADRGRRRRRGRGRARPRRAGGAAASKCGTRPSGGQPVRAAIERHAVGEERGVAAEAVDDEAADQRGVGGVEDGAGADEAGDDAAAVDVADQHDGDVGGPGEAHVGDVAGAEVDLGRAAGALDEDEVGLRREAAEAVEDRGQQGRLQGLVGCGRRRWRGRGPGRRPGRRCRSAASGGPGSCRRSARRGRRGPAAPGRGRSRRRRR